MWGKVVANEVAPWMLAKWTLPMLELSSKPKTDFAVLYVTHFAKRVTFL